MDYEISTLARHLIKGGGDVFDNRQGCVMKRRKSQSDSNQAK